MQDEQHDPFTGIDFDEEIKKNQERITAGVSKMLENFSKQATLFLQANNINHVCIEWHIDIDGRWSGRHICKTDMKKTLDCIEKGEPQSPC